jgi:hypothetical protein
VDYMLEFAAPVRQLTRESVVAYRPDRLPESREANCRVRNWRDGPCPRAFRLRLRLPWASWGWCLLGLRALALADPAALETGPAGRGPRPSRVGAPGRPLRPARAAARACAGRKARGAPGSSCARRSPNSGIKLPCAYLPAGPAAGRAFSRSGCMIQPASVHLSPSLRHEPRS